MHQITFNASIVQYEYSKLGPKRLEEANYKDMIPDLSDWLVPVELGVCCLEVPGLPILARLQQ
jgi:hypothetical protein